MSCDIDEVISGEDIMIEEREKEREKTINIVQHIITDRPEDPDCDSKKETVIQTTEIESMSDVNLGISADRIELGTAILWSHQNSILTIMDICLKMTIP